MTEPGGGFDLPTSVARDEFINEVVGVVMAKVPGESSLEDRIKTLCLSHRVAYHEIMRALLAAAVLSSTKGTAAAATLLAEKITEIAETACVTLHVIGMDDKTIMSPVTQAELDAEKAVCNCESCRQKRLEANKKPG